ncbi:hypothetical protein [Defluviimonas salinarum]|uniref:Uncharacterized protein n=1 Tax=Defluviimonas salinarum TaxID=2992147 RepID=A0ABT3J4C5_9RHOB|nr:hypothetical protein [Defluviimonas salinarum]MCW3782513.1 hypothetical protein [Defluviimonas salinarum]
MNVVIPDINDAPTFQAVLAPHLARLRLAKTFMQVDAKWSGGEALEFALLLEAMAGFLDGAAVERIAEARSRLDARIGVPRKDHAAGIRARNGTGFCGLVNGITGILHAGAKTNCQARWRAEGVGPFLALAEDLRQRCFEGVPGTIREIEARLEAAPDPAPDCA